MVLYNLSLRFGYDGKNCTQIPGQIEGYVEGRHIKLEWDKTLIGYLKKKALMLEWVQGLRRPY